MSLESFKGKVLEEVLAYLIRNAGYQLLVDPSQDPTELSRRGNGLVVKGRGAVHQVDVLGQLRWITVYRRVGERDVVYRLVYTPRTRR